MMITRQYYVSMLDQYHRIDEKVALLGTEINSQVYNCMANIAQLLCHLPYSLDLAHC